MTDELSNTSKNELKAIVKQAIREWLDEKYAQFGKWSAGGIAAIALAVLLWLALMKSGWRPPSQ